MERPAHIYDNEYDTVRRVRDAYVAHGREPVCIYDLDEGLRHNRIGWACLVAALGKMRQRGYLASPERKARGGFVLYRPTAKGYGLLRRRERQRERVAA